MSDLVSVIVPIYNTEPYLKSCVDSILSQTYTNLEIILVDDGSPDNCPAICDEYARSDSRVKVIHKANGGLSDARNHGIDAATGRYLAFIDSDDYVSASFIQKLYDLCRNNNCDIAQCAFMRVEADSFKPQQTDSTVQIYSNIEMLYNLYNSMGVETTVTWNKLYSSTLFGQTRFPYGLINEDEGTTYKLLYKSQRIARIDDALYFYRITPGSIMQKAYNAKRLGVIGMIEERLAFFEGIDDEKLYGLALKSYYYLLLTHYYYCTSCIDVNKYNCRRLKIKISVSFKKAICRREYSLKSRIGLLLFRIMPGLYGRMY